ncbi:MAG: protein kinase [Planctomycetes bacterium]|nr:protein kinase [Planctomycetota bacterium]
MAADRFKIDPSCDNGYWSIVAEFIDRRDRGEPVDPADFAKDDPALARRLRDCLAGMGWLEQALSGSDSETAPVTDRQMPQAIGEYSIIRELGRGGMGVVYEAVHQGLGRRVALKVLFDTAVQSRSARERFLREARTAASLHHTNIVPVFDAGTADGHLYFAMQLIDGRSLEEWAFNRDEPPGQSGATDKDCTQPASRLPSVRDAGTLLEPQQVARLGLQAAEALAYAHARGVIHRDVKPSNLILDCSGTLWVADFGLARRPEDAAVTSSGARVGTPRYMSPEQATAQWEAMDARTDIYSLGVTLYELLTGRALFSDSTPQQLLLQIIRSEPQRPRRLNRRIPRDLETIVLKAMAKRPVDRYRSAQELAEDLRRFLAHEPVRARRIGPVGRLARWCRREPVVATVSLVALATLTAVVSAYQVHLKTQRDAAVQATEDARQSLADALFERARAVRATQETGRRRLAIDLLMQSAAIRPRGELSVEAVRTLEVFDVQCTSVLEELGGPVAAVAFDPSSRRVAVGVGGRGQPVVAVWDRATASIALRLTTPGEINFVAFSPDGRRLAGTTDRHVCVWDSSAGALHVLAAGHVGLSTLAFSPDGSRLFGFADGLCVWDLSGGKLESRLLDVATEMGQVVVTGDGRTLAAAVATQAESRAEILRWSLPDLRPLEPLRVRDVRPDALAEAMGILSLAASPADNVIAASCGDSRIRLWDAQTGKPLGVLEGHHAPPISMAFTHQGDMLVSTDRFEVKLWDVRDGVELATLIRPRSSEMVATPALAASRDGCLATTGDLCRLWDLAIPEFHRVLARQRDRIDSIAVSPDGRWLAWMAEGRLRVWDWPDKQMRHEVPMSSRGEAAMTFTRDGRHIALVGTATSRIQVFEAATGRLYAEWPAEAATAIVASPDGRELVVAHSDGVIRRWNVATAQVTGAFVGHLGPVTSLALSPGGEWLAAGIQDTSGAGERTLFVWETSSGKLVRSLAAHPGVAFGVAFSPDGRRIASCGGDQAVKLWNAADGQLIAALTGHSQPVRGVAFNSDGSLLASCSLDGLVRIWDTAHGALRAELISQPGGSLSAIAFSSDDRWLLSAGGPFRWTHEGPGAVEAWDLSRLQQDLAQLGLGFVKE